MQITQKEHGDTMQLCRGEVRKAKAYVVLHLASDMKGNKILQVHKQQKEDQGKHGPLLNGTGALVTKDIKKAELLKAFFVSVLTSKTSFQESHAPETKIWSNADLPSVDDNQVTGHLNTLEIHKTMWSDEMLVVDVTVMAVLFIFERSWLLGEGSEDWKRENGINIFKRAREKIWGTTG